MIKIRPKIEFKLRSPYGNGSLVPHKILWQGMHTCVETTCTVTRQHLVVTLPSGHGYLNQFIVNPATQEIFCPESARRWFGEPLLNSLMHPRNEEIEMTVEKFRTAKKAIILNTIDYLYGHSLLKLLNAERHLNNDKKYGLIVIVQDFLRWMVPDGVAEIWTVKLPLKMGRGYHPSLHAKIDEQTKRFNDIFVSEAYSHPPVQEIGRFTRTGIHDDAAKEFRVTFIWRNDRPWFTNSYVAAAAAKIGIIALLRCIQWMKIIFLFSSLRKKLPNVRYTVAGLGRAMTFPSWIDDRRVSGFNEKIERQYCDIYMESRVVIGVHGSSMLLPSAHAGMTIDLMPKERWGNFAQDVLFREHDSRISAFRYRFLPISISLHVLTHIVYTEIVKFDYFKKQMLTQ